MADDRQIADIWRTQYTGPLFRKYADLEQLPEATIGYLSRQSRLAVDFCQTMMAPLGLKQYAVNTPLSLPSGETGVMRTHVIAGFGGMPIVTTRVKLDRKVVTNVKEEKEAKELPVGLFYFLRVDTDTQYQVGVDDLGAWYVEPYTCDLPKIAGRPAQEGAYHSFVMYWCGEESDDAFVLYHYETDMFYAPGGKELFKNPDSSWLGYEIVKAGNTLISAWGDKIYGLDINNSGEVQILAECERPPGGFSFNTKGDTGVAIRNNEIITVSISVGESVSVSVSTEAKEVTSNSDEDEKTDYFSPSYNDQEVIREYKNLEPCADAECIDDQQVTVRSTIVTLPSYEYVTYFEESDYEALEAIAFHKNDLIELYEKYHSNRRYVSKYDSPGGPVSITETPVDCYVAVNSFGICASAPAWHDGATRISRSPGSTSSYNENWRQSQGSAINGMEFMRDWEKTVKAAGSITKTDSVTTYAAGGSILFGTSPFYTIVSYVGGVETRSCSNLETYSIEGKQLLDHALKINVAIAAEGGVPTFTHDTHCLETQAAIYPDGNESIIIYVGDNAFDTGISGEFGSSEAYIEDYAYNADGTAIFLVFLGSGTASFSWEYRLYGVHNDNLTDLTDFVGAEALTDNDGRINLIDLCPLRPRNKWKN